MTFRLRLCPARPPSRTPPGGNTRDAVIDALWILKLTRPFMGRQVLAICCIAAGSLMAAAEPLVLKQLVDAGLVQGNWNSLVVGLCLLIALYVLRLLALLAAGLLLTAMALREVAGLRARLVRACLAMPASASGGYHVGELQRRVDGDVDQLAQVATELLPVLLRLIFTLVLSCAMMALLSGKLALLVLPFIPIFVLLQSRFRARLADGAEALREARGQEGAAVTEILQNIDHVQTIAGERYFLSRYVARLRHTARASLRQRTVESLYHLAAYSLFCVLLAGATFVAARDVFAGSLSIGSFVAFYTYMSRLFEPLGVLTERYASLTRARASLRRIRELDQSQRVRRKPLVPRSAARRVSAVGVAAADVGFGGGATVLRDVSYQLSRRDKTLLIAKSGAGKTTLARVLTELQPVLHGTTYVDVGSGPTTRARAPRGAVALLPRTPFLFSGTVKENCLLGESRLVAGDAALWDLARLASCDDVVRDLPGQWNCLLGPGGVSVSSGQCQRLALVRALAHRPALLLLDEGLSAVDPATELDILTALQRAFPEMGVLIISHRPSLSQWADRVLTIVDGRLVEPRASREHICAYVGKEPADVSPLPDSNPAAVRH